MIGEGYLAYNIKPKIFVTHENIFKNKVFVGVIGFIILVQVGMIYYGGNLFRTAGLTLKEFLIMILISLTVIPVDIMRKLWLKWRGNIKGV